MHIYFIIYILIINLLAFLIMGIDKKLAIEKKQRISEQTLFTFALLLGSIGIISGMFKFRHKTKKLKFQVLVPVCIILNILSIWYITMNFLIK